MDMVRHYNKFIQFTIFKMSWNLLPKIIGNFPKIIQFHLIIFNLT